jgi:hypothetical protein
LEFRGGLFQSPWTISLQEDGSPLLFDISNPAGLARNFPLCLGTGPEEKTLLLGALPRVEAASDEAAKKQKKNQ